jgi:DNA-binding HxlR family transcriptional regulator
MTIFVRQNIGMSNNFKLNERNELIPIDKGICFKRVLNITDTLDILTKKWSVSILISLSFGSKRFSEIAHELNKITDRSLSKSLKDLELNLLISKKTIDAFPSVTEYSLTEHGLTITKVLISLSEWGQEHRKKIFSKEMNVQHNN